MKAIQIKKFGTPEVLEYLELPTPTINDNEILLQIEAAGINPVDMKIRNGTSGLAKKLNLPTGLGFDLAGKVAKVGKNIKACKIGDSVVGKVNYDKPRAYAEYCMVTPNEIVARPKELSTIDAAALPTAGLTAWQVLHQYGKLQRGERVLIHAAAGGVGHLAVQIAKKMGAEVFATATQKNHQFLVELGADHCIDYTQTPFEKIAHDIDLVVDLVGGETGLRSFKVLKKNGRMVTVPTNTRDEIIKQAQSLGIQVSGILAEMNQKDLTELVKLLVAGDLKIQIARTFPLKETIQAHQLLETGRTQGKIVLVV